MSKRNLFSVDKSLEKPERVLLVGVMLTADYSGANETRERGFQTALTEAAELVGAAGGDLVSIETSRRDKPHPALFVGTGKAEELAAAVKQHDVGLVVFNHELTPTQERNLEKELQCRVLDRVGLILAIFAKRAQSQEGKLQVELAQLEYLLPRLRGWGESMSRQAGGRVAGGAGIGSRGPGETKIELDRRRIRTRMAKLRADIARMEPARRTQRGSRRRGGVPSVAIAGYTNAGKSTLLNRLTDAGVLVQDALFATLDPTVRRARAADGREYTLTDTVGFVRNLPTQLVEAFRSTLEEVGQADVILHVVDAAHPDPVSQVQAVRAVIDTIEGASDIPELIALNKADLASPEQIALLRTVFPGAVPLSAHTGWGVEALRAALEDMLPRPRVAIDAIVPYSAGSLVHRIHEEGEVEREEYVETGTRIVARVDEALAAIIAREAVGGIADDEPVSAS